MSKPGKGVDLVLEVADDCDGSGRCGPIDQQDVEEFAYLSDGCKVLSLKGPFPADP